MKSKKSELFNLASQQVERLQSLKNLILNIRMLDRGPVELNKDPVTESLKIMQQAFMESDWPAILPLEDRSLVNDHFWMVFETANYIDHLANPNDEKDTMLLTIDQLIQQATKRQEVAS